MRVPRPRPSSSTNAEDFTLALTRRNPAAILPVEQMGHDQGGSCCVAKPWERLPGRNALEAATSACVGHPPPPPIQMSAPVEEGPIGCAAIWGPWRLKADPRQPLLRLQVVMH